jgi:hypothetical protein
MKEHQFVDRYAELDPNYVKHKQDHYKNSQEQDTRVYTEKLFWDKLVHIGWRQNVDMSLDQTPIECLVLVCPKCEHGITKVVIKNIGKGNNTVSFLLNAKNKIKQHQTAYCKATAKQSKA